MRVLRNSERIDDDSDGMHDGMHERAQVQPAAVMPRMVFAASSEASPSPAIRLPRLSLKEAHALSVISRCAVDCYIAAEADNAEAHDEEAHDEEAHDTEARTRTGSAWHLTMTAGRSEPVAKVCDIVVHLNWSGARVRLMLPSRAVTVWMTSRLHMDIDEGAHDGFVSDEEIFTGMAGITRDAALEAMLGEALDRLGLSGLGKPELIGIETITETSAESATEATRMTLSGSMQPWLSHPLPHHFVVTLQAHASPTARPSAPPGPSAERRPTVMVCLETDGFGVMLIASLLQHFPEKPAPRRHDALRQRLRLIVGGASSTLAALQDLRAGDIVRCDWCSLAPRAPKWLAATSSTGQRWRLQMDADTPGRLIFLEQSEPANMIDNDAVFDEDHYGEATSGLAHSPHGIAGGDDARYSDAARGDKQEDRHKVSQEAIQALDALPVKVSFDLGSVTVALSTLRSWQPGEAIELTVPVGERQVVNIRANGMLIGQGELVDIDGHLGVIVSTLSEAADNE